MTEKWSIGSKERKMAIIQDKITSVATNMGVPVDLALAVANQESRFNQDARSPVGAIGVFQLMPQTAKGLNVDPYTEDGNIQGGITYLKQMLDRYKGNEALALAAYNAGPGNVSKYNGIPPFAETQNYVKTILSKIGIPMPEVGAADQGAEDGGNGGSLFAGLDSIDPGHLGVLALVAGGFLLLKNVG